ncbi:hypothetical protein J6A31_05715 [bacterium]|nr:hypothetical protein [bacterium]
MKYYVKYRIEARYEAEVEANNIEDAIKKSNEMLSNADFGEASDIDGDAVAIETDDGNRIWEK